MILPQRMRGVGGMGRAVARYVLARLAFAAVLGLLAWVGVKL